jgi:hypothetical protein
LLVSADAMLRARPAAAFARLNHILINGFFFDQEFAIGLFPSNSVGLRAVSQTTATGQAFGLPRCFNLESLALNILLVALVAGLLLWRFDLARCHRSLRAL